MLNGESQVEFKDLGRWWGNDPAAHTQTEIDIMGEQDNETALFGECKWTNEKVDTEVLDKLVKRSQMFHYRKVWLYLFGKNGFTEGCRRRAEEMGNVVLITYQDILVKK